MSELPPLDRALVADDSRVTRVLTVEVLKELGVAVLEAADGRESLRLAIEQRPPLLVLDGLMPGLTAFDLVARLRADLVDYKPVIIIQTAMYKSRRWESEARANLGVAEYLEKPVEPETLIETLQRHFAITAPKR